MMRLPGTETPAHVKIEQDVAERLRGQAMLDIVSRVAGGLYAYVVLWLVITTVSGLAHRFPLLVIVNLAGLAALSVLRQIIGRRLPQVLARQEPDRAHRMLVLPIIASAFYWGMLTAASVLLPDLEPIRWAMLVVAVGMCSAGTALMAIDTTLKNWYPMALIVPVSIATLLNFSRGNVLLSGLIVFYALYVMHTGRVVHTDYWQALRARHLLEGRARELELISLTDTLTQVPNRLAFDRQYALEWARACREHQPLSVMVLDLDHFKKINDTHGHPCGDRVLKLAASALKTVLHRATDMVARYGGEEFVVLLPNTDAEGARSVADRLLDRIREISLQHDGQVVRVTCSIGLASCQPTAPLDSASLIRRADQALYSAKQQGRDQVRCA